MTWLSFAVEYELLWGVNPAGFHFTNLLFHLVTAIGFYFVARRLLRGAPAADAAGGVAIGALTAALLFAVHPLRVESVAWATERREVLGGAWLMAAVFFYLRAADRGCGRRRGGALALSLLCYVLSLLSKASGITLPAVLLLLDVYPLGRFSTSMDSTLTPAPSLEGRGRRIFLEKVIFAVPAVVIALLALWAQNEAGALRGIADHPLGLRIGQAFYGVVFYPVKSLWPVDLIPLYEQRPDATALEAVNVASAVAVVGLTLLLWLRRKRHRAAITAWAVYLVLLSPMSGLTQAGQQVVADRYSYLPCMSWAVLFGGGVAQLWNRTRGFQRMALGTSLAMVVGALVYFSREQTRIWADTHTLWRTVVERAPDTPTAHANLAVELNAREDFAGARDHSLITLRRLPGNRTAHAALARASLELGDLETAERHHRIALGILEKVGKTDAATMVGLAIVETRLGRLDEAERTYRAVIELEPDVAEWHYDFGGFLASRGRYEEAAAELATALSLEPERAEGYYRLGIVQLSLGRPAEAIRSWDEGLRRAPRDVVLRAQLAWTLATCTASALRDGRRALALARGAVEDSSGNNVKAREALAAALAETGAFVGASEVIQALMSDPAVVETEATMERWRWQLDCYQRREPLRE